MKRDLNVNFGVLAAIAQRIKTYKNALEDIRYIQQRYTALLGDYKSEAVDALNIAFEGLQKEMESCEEELDDLYHIFSGYVEDMAVYIKPVQTLKMMRVDPDDIKWAIEGIASSSNDFHFMCFKTKIMSDPLPFLGSEEENEEKKERMEYNYNLLNNFRLDHALPIVEQIRGHVEELERLFHERIQPFEDEDDRYKEKADHLYRKYSTIRDQALDISRDVTDGVRSIDQGAGAALRNTVMMPVKILLAMTEFNAANTMYNITNPMGVTPKWALDYRMKQDKWAEGFDLEEFFSMDASYLVDSLGKGMSDMYEDEGIAYVIGNVGTNIAIGKFLGELKNVKAPVVANEAYDVIGKTTVFDFDSGIFLEAEIVALLDRMHWSLWRVEKLCLGSLGKSTMGASAFGALNLTLEGYNGRKNINGWGNAAK